MNGAKRAAGYLMGTMRGRLPAFSSCVALAFMPALWGLWVPFEGLSLLRFPLIDDPAALLPNLSRLV